MLKGCSIPWKNRDIDRFPETQKARSGERPYFVFGVCSKSIDDVLFSSPEAGSRIGILVKTTILVDDANDFLNGA